MAKVIHGRTILKSADTTVDDASWGFTFESATATDFSGIADISTALIAFVNAAGTGGSHPMAHYLGTVADRGSNAGLVELYDVTGHLDGTAAGAPKSVTNFTISNADGSPASNLPASIACVIGFKSPYGTDVEFGTGTRPRSRDRNRIYLGPLGINTVSDDTTTGRTKFTAAFRTDVLASMFSLASSHGTAGWALRVWSRAASAVKLVDQAWMDDQPDVQRRRLDPNPASRVYRSMPAV